MEQGRIWRLQIVCWRLEELPADSNRFDIHRQAQGATWWMNKRLVQARVSEFECTLHRLLCKWSEWQAEYRANSDTVIVWSAKGSLDARVKNKDERVDVRSSTSAKRRICRYALSSRYTITRGVLILTIFRRTIFTLHTLKTTSNGTKFLLSR